MTTTGGRLSVAGSVEGTKLDLEFRALDFDLQQIAQIDPAADVSGRADVHAKIYGDIGNPVIAAEFSAEKRQFIQTAV